jgi:hypothetical protein
VVAQDLVLVVAIQLVAEIVVVVVAGGVVVITLHIHAHQVTV